MSQACSVPDTSHGRHPVEGSTWPFCPGGDLRERAIFKTRGPRPLRGPPSSRSRPGGHTCPITKSSGGPGPHPSSLLLAVPTWPISLPAAESGLPSLHFTHGETEARGGARLSQLPGSHLLLRRLLLGEDGLGRLCEGLGIPWGTRGAHPMGPPSRGQSRRHHPRSPSLAALDDLPFEPLAAPLHGHHSGPASNLSCTWPCTGLTPAPGLMAVEAVTWQRARGVAWGCTGAAPPIPHCTCHVPPLLPPSPRGGCHYPHFTDEHTETPSVARFPDADGGLFSRTGAGSWFPSDALVPTRIIR